MLSLGPLRAQLRRGLVPLVRSPGPRYFHSSSTRKSDKKPPTTPPPSSPTPNTSKSSESEFWEKVEFLDERSKQFQPDNALKKLVDIRTGTTEKPTRSSLGITAREAIEGEEGGELGGFLRQKKSAEEEFSDARGDLVEEHQEELAQRYQQRGLWDNNAARKVIAQSKGISQDREEVTKLSGSDIGERNQRYKVGDHIVTVEDVDEGVIQKLNELEIEEHYEEHSIRERKEDAIYADNDAELVDILLDRPSKAEEKIAAMKGEELLEFDSQEEFIAFEARKGAPKEEVRTSAQNTLIKQQKRGPSMKKNENGAYNLTLLYDEQATKDRSTAGLRDPLKKLKYVPIYPKKIKTWVTYMKQCKGRYNMWGYWENDAKLQHEENELKEVLKAKARAMGDTGLTMMKERRKRQSLPADLEGQYRFGVQPDELVGAHPKVKELMSFRHANNPEIHAFRTKQLIKRWQERPDDSGTPQVQIACMTNRVRYLTEHLKKHKKDNVTRLQLRLLLSKRQSLLKYLRKKNVPVYFQLVQELEIQDISY